MCIGLSFPAAFAVFCIIFSILLSIKINISRIQYEWYEYILFYLKLYIKKRIALKEVNSINWQVCVLIKTLWFSCYRISILLSIEKSRLLIVQSLIAIPVKRNVQSLIFCCKMGLRPWILMNELIIDHFNKRYSQQPHLSQTKKAYIIQNEFNNRFYHFFSRQIT